MLPRVQHTQYSRNGSNPVINSGHGAYADVPAIVSGQHSHPSHVPGQYSPRKWEKRETSENADRSNRCQELMSHVNCDKEEMCRPPSSNWKSQKHL